MNNERHSNRSPKDIDVYAGEQLKKRRQEVGMSQKAIAESVGITFQQIQKYEKGLNRIGASRLYEFCRILQVTPSYFFEHMGEDFVPSTDGVVQGLADSGRGVAEDIIELIKLFNNIKDVQKRSLLMDLIRSMQD